MLARSGGTASLQPFQGGTKLHCLPSRQCPGLWFSEPIRQQRGHIPDRPEVLQIGFARSWNVHLYAVLSAAALGAGLSRWRVFLCCLGCRVYQWVTPFQGEGSVGRARRGHIETMMLLWFRLQRPQAGGQGMGPLASSLVRRGWIPDKQIPAV